jgi:hypothetical protein
LRAELAGPEPTSVERLLVERVVARWLQVQDADVRYAQAKDLSLAWGAYYQRRMDRAHKRYLSAIRTLALVRRLALPVLQVNIARKQVNVVKLASFHGITRAEGGTLLYPTQTRGDEWAAIARALCGLGTVR